jgi:hypothetical protein
VSEHTADYDVRASRRLDQIEGTAHRVTPTDVGQWCTAVASGPADGVVIAPADLRWLIAVARSHIIPPERTDDA